MEKQENMEIDDIFGVASFTKAITTVAFMILIERGKCHLQQPVITYIHEFSNLKVLEDDESSLKYEFYN